MLAMLTVSIIAISSCGGDGEDDAVAAPEASFTSAVDGKTVEFTNTSEGEGNSYTWDFGDGNTSTEAEPTHTYEANGSYVVKLTATNEGGSDDTQAVLEITNIIIDGDLSDWDDVPALVEGGTGFLTTMKVENLANNKLFVYVEANENMEPLNAEEGTAIQIMLDTDNDPATGRGITWYWATPGEDYLIEGTLLGPDGTFTLFKNNPESDPGLWDAVAWETISAVKDDYMETSELQEIAGGYAYEISIDLSALPTEVNAETIRIGVHHNLKWAANSFIPTQWNEADCPECTLVPYNFK